MKPPSSLPAFAMSWAALTDQGRRRQNNEDAWGAFAFGTQLTALDPHVTSWPEHGILLAVSDGMGGANAGEVASHLCIERLSTSLHQNRDTRSRATAMRDAFRKTHFAVVTAAMLDPAKQGMGATLSALWLCPDGTAIVGHVGDSRILHRKNGIWCQVTDDHSVGAGMVRRGEIAPDAVSTLRFHAMLEQAMGADGIDVQPQVVEEKAEPGDVWLICSDGLYGPLGDGFFNACDQAFRFDNLSEGATALVRAANAAGGPDNITAALVRM